MIGDPGSPFAGGARLPLAAQLVIDEVDAHLASAVAAEGIEPIVAASVMSTPAIAAALARTVLDGAVPAA